MQFQYGTPSQPLAERPRCWSKSHDEGSRECRGCSFQTSCKEEIIRLNAMRPMAAPAPQPQYYAPQYQPQYQQPFQPYAVPQPVQVIQPPPVQQSLVPQFKGLTSAPATAPVLATPVMNAQPMRPVHPVPPQQYGYGWIQDPMYYALTSAPPPMRPQMGDETFFGRVVKNTGLAMLESFFGQCLLAVRQMVLPPAPRVIDIPQQPQHQQYEAPRQ